MPREPIPLGGLGTIRVKKIAPGRHQADAYCRDTDGRRRRLKATAATKERARNKLIASHSERSAPSGGTLTKTTAVAEASRKWIAQLQNSNAKAGTISSYTRHVDTHIIPTLGQLTLGQLTASRVQAFVDSMRDTPATSKTVRGVLSQIMDMCVRDDAIPTNPVTSTKPPRTTRAPVKALTAVEIQEIRSHVIAWGEERTYGPPRNAPLLLDFLDVLAGTGARSGEVLALRWEDVDLAAGTIDINGTLIRSGGTLQRQDSPKSASSRRTIQLPHFVVMVLEQRYRHALVKTGPVFPSRAGSWIEASNMQRTWTSARGERFKHVTFRDYRKAVATLIRKAQGMEAAAAQLGHSTPEITRRHYVERDGRVDFAEIVGAFGRASLE